METQSLINNQRSFIPVGLVAVIVALSILATIFGRWIWNEYFLVARVGIMSVLIFWAWLELFRTRRKSDQVFILGFVLYLLMLLVLASDPLYSFEAIAKVGIGMGAYFVGVLVGREHGIDRKILNVFRLGLYFLVIFFISSQVFGWGHVPYGGHSEMALHGSVYISNLLVYILIFLAANNWISNRNDRRFAWADILMFCFGILTVVAIYRRSSILALVLGFLVFFFFMEKKVDAFRFGLLFVIVGLLATPWILPVLEGLSERRDMTSAMVDPTAGRHSDFLFAWEVVQERNLAALVVGEDVLQPRTTTGRGRNTHNDFARLLITTGIVGVLAYLAIYYVMCIHLVKLLSYGALSRHAFGGGVAILAASFVLTYTNQLWVISSMNLWFLTLGLLIGNGERFAKRISAGAEWREANDGNRRHDN